MVVQRHYIEHIKQHALKWRPKGLAGYYTRSFYETGSYFFIVVVTETLKNWISITVLYCLVLLLICGLCTNAHAGNACMCISAQLH